MENSIYFFFIDDQGDVKNDQKLLILGGVLIKVADYHNLSREIKKHNNTLINQEVREIKWSDLSAAIYLKNKNQEIKPQKSFYYLKDINVESIKKYIKDFFSIINKYNYQITLSVSNKDYFKTRPSEKFIELQIEV